MTTSRVLVTGASGQLATAIVRAFADHEVTALTRAMLDVADGAAVARAVAEIRPGLIINCAAFNLVDEAEQRPADAFAVNAFAVRHLARAAEAHDAVLVHYGSDFVFDGTADHPYEETAQPRPRSVYASSKLLGDWLALEIPRAYVLRVESLFGSLPGWMGRRGTFDGLVSGLLEGREVPAFTDRTVSPSYMTDVAAATRHLVDVNAPAGLYHCVNSGYGTWHEVVVELARALGVAPHIRPVTMNDVPLAAARPRFCALSNQKLVATGASMPPWQDAVRRWLAARGCPAA